MATKLAGQIGRSDMFKLDPAAVLVREGHNPRKHFDVEDLTQSILQHGVLQPIIVEKDKDNVYLIDGERRLRACKQAVEQGHDISIPAIVAKGKQDRQSRLIQALIGNQGEPLTPLEEAEAFGELRDAGMSAQSIGQSIGKSKVHVYARLKLLNADDSVKQAIEAKQIGVKQADVILKKAETPEEQAEMVEEAKQEFSANKVKKEANKKATMEAKKQEQEQGEPVQAPLDLGEDTVEPKAVAPNTPNTQKEPKESGKTNGNGDNGRYIKVDKEDMTDLLSQNVDELHRLRATAEDHDLELFTQGVIRGLCMALGVKEEVALDY